MHRIRLLAVFALGACGVWLMLNDRAFAPAAFLLAGPVAIAAGRKREAFIRARRAGREAA